MDSWRCFLRIPTAFVDSRWKLGIWLLGWRVDGPMGESWSCISWWLGWEVSVLHIGLLLKTRNMFVDLPKNRYSIHKVWKTTNLFSFLPFLDHGHQYHYMRNIDQQQCEKKTKKTTAVNIQDMFFQSVAWLVAPRNTSRFSWYLILWSARFEDRWAVGCHCHGARLPPGTGGGFPRHHASQFGCFTLVPCLCWGVVQKVIGLDALAEKGHGEKTKGLNNLVLYDYESQGQSGANVFYFHLIRHPFSSDFPQRLTETDLEMNCRPGSAPLLVGGDSAGGGTAVSLILRLKQGAGWMPQGARWIYTPWN